MCLVALHCEVFASINLVSTNLVHLDEGVGPSGVGDERQVHANRGVQSSMQTRMQRASISSKARNCVKEKGTTRVQRVNSLSSTVYRYCSGSLLPSLLSANCVNDRYKGDIELTAQRLGSTTAVFDCFGGTKIGALGTCIETHFFVSPFK